jgi:cellulose synthase/poly-beta-1,6-N-acetylglucosamine synthase-like glycosyltransferase
MGKAQALNEALSTPIVTDGGAEAELAIIYDADHRPAPDSLRALVAPLADPRVAAVSGRMRVSNGQASPAAFYAMIESLVHQLITMRGKDRLDLAPALLGSNCAYRLSALRAAGGFRRGALLEDSDLTLALALAGGRTRFAADSLSDHQAPATLNGYLQQHLRWNRGFHQAARGRLGSLWASSHLSLGLKLELTLFALGYADRLALMVGALFTVVDFLRPGTFGFPLPVWLAYFGLPLLEMVVALTLTRASWSTYVRLTYVPFFFLLDILIVLWSSVQSLLGRPVTWALSERPHDLAHES